MLCRMLSQLLTTLSKPSSEVPVPQPIDEEDRRVNPYGHFLQLSSFEAGDFLIEIHQFEKGIYLLIYRDSELYFSKSFCKEVSKRAEEEGAGS